MKASILVIASIFLAPLAFAQQDVAASTTQKIKILSWNIYMLPGFLGNGKIPRANAIGALLDSCDYDVLLFQEAFHQRARKIIRRYLTPALPFQVGPANRKLFSFKTSSGLWIFSKHPIQEVHSIVFKARHGIDAMSRKGALLAEIIIDHRPIQVVATHLQNSGEDHLKQQQCAELFQLLKLCEKENVAQVIGGDFNIDWHEDKAGYDGMLQKLDAVDAISGAGLSYSYDRINNDLKVERELRQDLIDYILLRPNQVVLQPHERIIRTFQSRWHRSHRDLSDHYALETVVTIESGPIFTAASQEP